MLLLLLLYWSLGELHERSNPARASTRQGAHGSLSDVSLIQHQSGWPGQVSGCSDLSWSSSSAIVGSLRNLLSWHIDHLIGPLAGSPPPRPHVAEHSVHRWRASSLLPPHNLHTSLPPSKITPVSEKVVVPSGEVDNMAQIVAIEPSNKMCRHIFNSREPDLCLLTSCQLCPPKLPFVVPSLLNCIFNCLLAQWGSVGLDQGPVHSYPTLSSSRKVIQ